MKLFKDAEYTQEINELNLGIVDAGFSKDYTFYLLNEADTKTVDIKFIIDHPEVEITKAPTEMTSEGKSTLHLKWSPIVTLHEPLKTTVVIEDALIYEPK